MSATMKQPFAITTYICALACLPFLAAQRPASAGQPTLTVKPGSPIAKVSPTFYGLMTEEINYSYDGGLYAELVRDRAIGRGFGALMHWPIVERGDAKADVSIDESTGPSAALPRSLKLNVTAASAAAPAGVENDGYWGIPVRPQTTYHGSFYAKSSLTGLPVTVSLINDATGAVAATATIAGVGSDWKQYSFTLRTGAVPVSTDNHLVLTIDRPATLWLDLVSLFPPAYHNRPGGNRADIMEKLAAMHPQFLRFPGGNYLEGNRIADRFDWKKTIGPWVDRPTHPSPWGYRSSDGMGLLEFLDWCEDLHMQPVLAVYAGYSLQHDHVEPGAALEPYVQDALDEIEYVTGGPDTKWGAERAKDGHPAPFALHYVEIGNEDWFDRSGSYDARFAQFARAIRRHYPGIQLIATAPVKTNPDAAPDVLDEHFYMSAEESFAEAHHYDNHPRTGPRIFVGEWATREGDPTPDLHAALADAAWLTGLERNSDLVIMASYAPLFTNVNPGGLQWAPDLIGYNALTSYGSPSYWVQEMFASHIGTEIVPATLANAGPRLFASATRDAARHKLFIKIVNANSTPQPLSIELDGAQKPLHGVLITLTGKTPNATNSIVHPDAVTPRTQPLDIAGPRFGHSFAPYSVNVLEISE
jgi:alpha-N-arabinofuranosidase